MTESKENLKKRIDTNKNQYIENNEVDNFAKDKKNGDIDLNNLGEYLNNLPLYNNDELKKALNNFFRSPERGKYDQEIKNKIKNNQPLDKTELSLMYLAMISEPNKHFTQQQLKFDSSKPVDQICDGALIGFIRTKYNYPTYTGEKVKIDLPNETKKKTNIPIDKIQENKRGDTKLPENIGEIKESEADFYCDRLITRAEKNFTNDIEKAKRELEQKHRYKNEEEKKAYIKRDTLLIAFSKYTEAINSQHEKHISNSGYKDKTDFENQMKLIEEFGKEIERKYPNINNILEKIKKFDEEMKANEKKYFKNENETKKAEKNYKEFNEYMDKKSKEYNIDKIQESLKKEPKTKEEMEEYLQTMNKIFEFQEDLNKKNKTYGGNISKYQNYIKGAIDIQKKYNIQEYQEILEKYNQDITNWNKKIDFKKYENYKNGLDWKLEVGLKNINTLQGIIINPQNEYFPVKEIREVERKKQIKQDGIDRFRERLKKFSPGAYWTLTTFTGLWNGLIDATIGVSTSLGVMILGIIGGTDETLSQMDRKARRDNFFKIGQSSSQKESVYDSETGFNFHADNTVSTIASSISQMLTLIYGGGAFGSGASKVLGISENIAGRVGLFTSSFITQVGGSYQEAITHGLTGKNAIGYSFLSATIQSSLELVSPNDVLLGKGNGIAKELIRNACNEGGKQSFMLIGKTFLKNVGLEILEENIQEGLQTAAGNLINMVVNGTYGSKLGADWSWKNFASTAIITTLTTGITTGVSTGVQMYEMSNQDQTKLIEHIKSDNGLYLEVTGMLDKAIEGKISIPNISIEQLQNLKLSLTGNSNINTPSTNTNIQTDYEIKSSPEIEQISQILGSRFHEERRQSRLQSDGTYAPRVEKVTDQTWISKHNGQTEVDIANTHFEDLPSDWKSENLEAAKIAVGLVYDMVKKGEKVTSEIIEKMAEIVHNKRLERNGIEGSFENQRVPYEQLSESEKEKDRNQLLRAIETVKQGNTDYFDGKSHKIFEGNTGKAESNSKLSDKILNEINEQNKSAKLEELRKEIREQYKQATGEDLELTDEQVLSILDAHEQDGELGKLKLGELKVKVKILSEAITDTKVRRFLLEAGFCGSEKIIKIDTTQDITRRLDYCGYSESTNNEIINFLHRGGTLSDIQDRLDYIDYIIGCHIEEHNVTKLLELYEHANIPAPNLRFEFMAHYTEHGIHKKYKYTSEIEKVLKKIKKLEDLGIGRIAIRDIDEYNKIERDFEKLSKLKDLGVTIDKQNIQELNNFEFNFENLKRLRDFGIDLYYISEKKLEKYSKIERDFENLKKLRDEFGIEVNVHNIEDFNNTKRDFEKLNKLRDLGVWIDTYNIGEINNFKFDFEKLINLKNNGFNINNRREFSKLEISQEEIELCKEYGISHYYDVIFFLSITKNADRIKIKEFIKRKNEYLNNNRTLTEQRFIELFGGNGFEILGQDGKKGQIGKYGKIDINQRGLGLCYAYSGFELLKKTNGFNELIQTNLRETENGWEVRIPFCDPNGTRIKVKKNEIDKTITITKKNGDTKTECINSKSEMLGFKILEIAFMKKMIINRYQKAEKNIGGITIDYRYRDLKKAYEEFTNTGDITLTGILIGSLEGQGTGFLYDGVWETMLPEDYYTIHAHTEMKDLAFNEFSKGLHKIDLGYQKETINHHKFGTEIIITENEIFGFGIIVKNAKIINKSGETIEGKYSIDNEGNITEKIGNQSDIIGTTGGKNAVCFFPHHAYSIEKCYIDQTTGEKRVWVINPRHTGIKFDISLEQCKQIFEWNVTGINIDNMFRDEGTSDKSIDNQQENNSSSKEQHEKVQEFIRNNCSEPIDGVNQVIGFNKLSQLLIESAQDKNLFDVKKSIEEGNAKDRRIYELPAYKQLIEKGFILPSDVRTYYDIADRKPVYHLGVDYNVKGETEVKSMYKGKVVKSGLDGGLGHKVIIEHEMEDGTKFYSLYGHLGPKNLPTVGQTVEKGMKIGEVGEAFTEDNGNWNSHLHFQIMENLDSPWGYSEIEGEGNYDVLTSFGKDKGIKNFKDKDNSGDNDYFNGKSHQFEVTETQARSNSKNMDKILSEINEENKSEKLEELRKEITEQYKESTGEELQLSDEQLLSIIDAHEQDGIIGELTLGQLRKKVKILDETIKDEKIRRFLLEFGFCGSRFGGILGTKNKIPQYQLNNSNNEKKTHYYQINEGVRIPRSNGSSTRAKITSYNQGIYTVEWSENGHIKAKELTQQEIDQENQLKMNPEEITRFNKNLPLVYRKGGLYPSHKINIGDGTTLYTTDKIVGKNSGRQYIIGYTFDNYGTMHLRQFYRSMSEGCWRACPGMREDGNLSKGEFITDSSYETTTKVDLSLGNTFDNLKQTYYNDFGPYNNYFSYSPISYIASSYNKNYILSEDMGPQNIYIRKLFPNLVGNDKTGHNKYNATDFYAGKYGHTIESVMKGYNNLIPEGLDYKHMKIKQNKSYSYQHKYLGKVNVQICTIKRNGIDLDFHFAKAINSPDKVRIENVVTSDAQINSRGIYNKQINAGPLVAKPVDYKEQCPNGRNIDQILPKVSPDYRDIRNLYQGNPIIKKFKQISK